MKNLLLTIALVFGVIFTSNAQDTDTKSKSTAGIKGGYNLAAVSYDGEGETGQRSGFHVGVFGESYLSIARLHKSLTI